MLSYICILCFNSDSPPPLHAFFSVFLSSCVPMLFIDIYSIYKRPVAKWRGGCHEEQVAVCCPLPQGQWILPNCRGSLHHPQLWSRPSTSCPKTTTLQKQVTQTLTPNRSKSEITDLNFNITMSYLKRKFSLANFLCNLSNKLK